jgi:hypothetical protein
MDCAAHSDSRRDLDLGARCPGLYLFLSRSSDDEKMNSSQSTEKECIPHQLHIVFFSRDPRGSTVS